MSVGLRKAALGLFFALTLSILAAFPAGSFSEVPPNEKNRYRGVENDIYLLVNHLIRLLLYLFLSGVFAGLTIGIMSMDTLTFDVIATSGPEPDRTYASRVLPLRRQGHRTLCTLVFSNILMNVLIVQEVAEIIDIIHDIEGWWWIQKAVKGNSALSSFIISTLIIVIFTEIIPMSICKSKYSLQIAAAGYGLVRAAMIVAYPVATPLGKLLDYYLPHGVGQIYDRNELRKLMILHCEVHGDRSGLARSEMLLLIAAMDFHEKKVAEIMVPIENVTTVRADEVITVDLIQRLWADGCSRIPVEQSPKKFLGVLLLKDLLTLPLHDNRMASITVGEVVTSKSRPIVCVDVNTLLPTILRFFQQSRVHMLFVSSEDRGGEVSCKKGGDYGISVYSPIGSINNAGCGNVVGVVTLEDVMEALIQDEIYDEYDEREFSGHEYFSQNTFVPIAFKDVLMPLEEPAQMERVNFFSFFRPTSSSSSSSVAAAAPLTNSQVWAVAYYLTRAVSAFFLWHPGYVKMLLDETVDEQFFPQFSANERSLPIDPLELSVTGGSQRVFFSGAQDSFPSLSNMSEEPAGCLQPVHYADLISIATEERFVLYRNGVQSTTFTLILGGRVVAAVGSDKFPLTRGPFEFFAENALRSSCYIPDFDAVILFPTRLYRITRECYMRYSRYNDLYNKFYVKCVAESKKAKNILGCMHSKTLPVSHTGNPLFSFLRKSEKDELLQPLKGGALYGTFGNDKSL